MLGQVALKLLNTIRLYFEHDSDSISQQWEALKELGISFLQNNAINQLQPENTAVVRKTSFLYKFCGTENK